MSTDAAVNNLLDIREFRLENFSGNDADWDDWKFSFIAYVNIKYFGMHELMTQAIAENVMSMDAMEDEAKRKSQQLYYILAMALKGKGRKIARTKQQVPEGNGFQLWKVLMQEYEPQVEGRHQSMLTVLLARPGWT